jgi:5'-nucleotidase
MTYIFVTNDDGVHAPGLQALAEAMTALGTVVVAAPAVNQSASGHKKTIYGEVTYEHTTLANGMPAMAIHSSPADCIALSAMGLNTWPPDLVVSGINRGENLSQDITSSGTVTAAFESVIQGIPALAVSLANRTANTVDDYRSAAQTALLVAQSILQHKLPPMTILNLNVPATPPKGIRITRQGVRIFREQIEKREGVVKIVGEPPTGILDEIGTDIWALETGYASITPIHLDMTAHKFMSDLAAWDIEIKE